MKNLAIIPARGGSKGIKKKNLQLLNEKPLLYWTIKSAASSGCFDYIHISTDDVEIQHVGVENGARCDFLRPAELSGDEIGTSAAIIHDIKKLQGKGFVFDTVTELQPTYCFRSSSTITRCLTELLSDPTFTSIATCQIIESTSHPDYCVSQSAKGEIIFGNQLPDNFARQILKPRYSCHGVVLSSAVHSFLKHETFFVEGKTKMLILENKLNFFDINESTDLEIARALCRLNPSILDL